MKFARLLIWIIAAALLPTASVTAEDPPTNTKTTEAADTARAPVAKPEKVVWYSYAEGVAKAKKEKKPIVIDFTASWCGWCKRMDRDTFSDREVIDYLAENLVPIKVWGDANTPTSHEGEAMTERDLAKLYGVRGYPMFWFLDSDAGRIGIIQGYKKPHEFLPLIKYVGGSHYKTMSYESFLKKDEGQG
ncbi:MAG TPA: thioredoxin family protein [Acidobacteriota bacterium]|nr:thioredoxin family protein [Acidobacteriota bacterium]